MTDAMLIEAIQEVPEPPCTGCYRYDDCKDNGLACQKFVRYCSEGAVDNAARDPSKGRFDRLFSGGDDADE